MNIAIILAGGIGTRIGSNVPKQYIEVGERQIISYCIEQLAKHEDINAIQIVADYTWHENIKNILNIYDVEKKFRGFSKPGKNRQYSIFNSLKDILNYATDNDYVLIHDAVRPLISKKQITDCIVSIKGHDGVIPVLPMKDTAYLSNDGIKINSLLNRNNIFAGQAPELFKFKKYYQANEVLLPDKILQINGSTEPAILAGMDIIMISGDENNYKITTNADLQRFKELIINRKN